MGGDETTREGAAREDEHPSPRAEPEDQDAGEHRFAGDAEAKDGAAGAGETRTPGMGS